MKTIVFLLAFVLVADQPKSPLATQARKAYDQQLKWTDSQYEQAVAQAQKKRDAAVKAAQTDYHTALRKGMDLALKSKDLEEANRIDGEMKNTAPEPTKTGAPKSPPMEIPGRWMRISLDGQAVVFELRQNGTMDAVNGQSDWRRWELKDDVITINGEDPFLHIGSSIFWGDKPRSTFYLVPLREPQKKRGN